MKKLLIIPLLALASCTNYSKCPTGPYGEHEFDIVLPHDTYSSWSCRYCGLYYESEDNSDYVRLQHPKTGDMLNVPMKKLYPKYQNQHELKDK